MSRSYNTLGDSGHRNGKTGTRKMECNLTNKKIRRMESKLVVEQLGFDSHGVKCAEFVPEPMKYLPWAEVVGSYSMVVSNEDEIEPVELKEEIGVVLSQLTLEVLDVFAEEAPLVVVRREVNYWTSSDEVDEQEWLRDTLLTKPKMNAERPRRKRAYRDAEKPCTAPS